MKNYTFKDRKATLEHFISEYKCSDTIYTRIYGDSYLKFEKLFCDIFKDKAKHFYIISDDMNAEEFYIKKVQDKYDIIYIDKFLSPAKLCEILLECFSYMKIGGLLICNYFFDNKPSEDFEKNPRYGIDSFCFVNQFNIDIIFKGSQIIIKKIN